MAEANEHKEEVFSQRLDFYFQYIALYTILLVLYSLVAGSVKEGTLTLTLYDPIVILFAVLIVFSGIPLLYKVYRRRSLIIGDNYIIFRSRFGKKKFEKDDIHRVSLGREKMIRVRQGSYRVIKLMIKGRRTAVRIRPGSYYDTEELVSEIIRLKKKLNK